MILGPSPFLCFLELGAGPDDAARESRARVRQRLGDHGPLLEEPGKLRRPVQGWGWCGRWSVALGGALVGGTG